MSSPEAPAWLREGRAEATGARPAPRWLWAAAVVPWLVLLVVVLTGGPGTPSGAPEQLSLRAPADPHREPTGTFGQHTDTSPPAGAPTEGPAPPPTDGPAPPPTDAPAPAPGDHDPSPWSAPGAPSDPPASAPTDPTLVRATPGGEEAVALASVVARAWLTGIDPLLTIDGLEPVAGRRYLEHLAVEAVERPTADTAVVTLLAVLLEGEDPLRATVRRLAVPVAVDPDGARPGGTPWWLPGPDLTTRELDTETVQDPAAHAEATEALEVAGYVDVELLELATTGRGPEVATVRATTPDGEPVEGAVWLRRTADGRAVAGTPRHRPAPPDAEVAGTGTDDAPEERP